jgi:hypothetical protein
MYICGPRPASGGEETALSSTVTEANRLKAVNLYCSRRVNHKPSTVGAEGSQTTSHFVVLPIVLCAMQFCPANANVTLLRYSHSQMNLVKLIVKACD